MHDKYVDGSIQHSDTPTPLTHNEELPDPLPSRRQGKRPTPEEKQLVRQVLIESLPVLGNISAACRQAGIHPSTVYDWLETDPDFADVFQEADRQANDALRGEAWRRGVHGVPEPIVSMGKLVRDEDTGQPLTVQKYSDNLLTLLMRARMPEYRDSRQVTVDSTVNVNTSHQLTIDTRGMSQDDLTSIRAIAERMKAQEQARIEKTGKADNE